MDRYDLMAFTKADGFSYLAGHLPNGGLKSFLMAVHLQRRVMFALTPAVCLKTIKTLLA